MIRDQRAWPCRATFPRHPSVNASRDLGAKRSDFCSLELLDVDDESGCEDSDFKSHLAHAPVVVGGSRNEAESSKKRKLELFDLF